MNSCERMAAIECARKSLGMSQAELADKAGVTKAYYSMLKSGIREAGEILLDKLEQLVYADVSLEQETTETEEAESQAFLVRNYVPEEDDFGEVYDPAEWMENIEKCRQEYGVSQGEVARYAGITQTYYSLLVSGRKQATEKLLKQLEQVVELFNPAKEIQILFDYVRIRFQTTDARYVIECVMNIRMQHMIEEAHAFYGYGRQYIYGDIVVMASPEKEKGVLLELKGKGCRQFEAFLRVQDRSWYDFFETARKEGAVFKRIDIAINDRAGILDIPELAEKCRRNECITLFHSYKDYQSGEMVRTREVNAATMGSTLYLGSLKSEIYFCIYEKDYEQLVKNGIPLFEAETKNRFEIRLKDSRAEHAVDDLLEYRDVALTAFSIINHYARFVTPDEEKESRFWELDKRWAWFMSGQEREIKLTTAPEPYTLDRVMAWLHRQVAPSLKMVSELGKLKGKDVVGDMIKQAKLSAQHRKILEQQQTPLEETVEEAHWQEVLRREYMGAMYDIDR